MIEQILENNEKIVWRGKQDLKTTLVYSIGGFILFRIIGYILYNSSNSTDLSCEINNKPATPEECSKSMKGFSYGFFLISTIFPIISYLYFLVTEYVITDKRLIIKSGVIGTDINSVYYDQIKTIFVNVGLLGKIFGTGSIFIDTGRITSTKNGTKISYDKFSNIEKPYEVYKIAQEFLSNNKEALYSGRSDFKYNKEEYKDFIQETEKFKKEI